MPIPIQKLHDVKALSDKGNYDQKTRHLRDLIAAHPDEFFVDSEDKGFTGLTHRPTGYRYHLPQMAVPLALRAPKALPMVEQKADSMVDFGDKVAAPLPKVDSYIRPVPAVKNGQLSQVDPDEVDYEAISPGHMWAESTHLAPLLGNMKGARAFIASKYISSQALPLKGAEVALVDTLDEETGEPYNRTLGKQIGMVNSRMQGTVHSINNNAINIMGVDGKMHSEELHHYYPSARKTSRTDTPIVKLGDKVEKNQPIAHSNYVTPDGTMAMGRNLRVAFVPGPHGSTFEDSIAISQSAADKMTSQHLYGYDLDHKLGVESGKKKYISLFPNKYTNEQLAKIGNDGHALPGAKLRPGDPIILGYHPRNLSTKDTALGNLHKIMRNSYSDITQEWTKPTEGTIADAVKTRSGLAVNIATEMPLRTGDKVSGRGGSKGVVGRVIPDDQMFHDADGKPVDILMNPQALIGRVNPSNVYEALLGKVAMKTGKPYHLPSFSKDSTLDFVQSELDKNGLKDNEDLFDPETKRRIPNVLTGHQYFLKLEHTGESKVSGRGEAGTDLNDQPSRSGGFESAKRLGGLVNNALLSHGGLETLRDAKLNRGSKNAEMWTRIRNGDSLPAPKVPFIFNKFIDTMKGAGINVQRKGDRFQFMAMTDDEVDKLARHELKSGETVDQRTNSPISGGLFDERIHGADGTQWSKITLDRAMPNPLMEDPIRSFLGLTKNKYREIIAGRDSLNGRTGAEAIEYAVKALNFSQIEAEARNEIRTGRASKRNEAVKRLNHSVGFQRMELEPSDLFMTKVPVIPPTYRPITKIGNMMMVSDPNILYHDLFSSQRALKMNRDELPDSELGDEKLAVYDSIKAIQGLGDPVNPETAAKGVKGFIRTIAGSGGPKCYDDKTEILTESGWIPFPDYNDSSIKIATLNPDTQSMEFQCPSAILHESYSGSMIHTMIPRKLDLFVTEGHYNYVEKCIKRGDHGRRTREWLPAQKIQAGDLTGKTQRVRYITAASQFNGVTPAYVFEGNVVDTQALAEFIGWYIAEGWIVKNSVVIAQKDGTDGADQIDDVLSRLGLPFTKNIQTTKRATKSLRGIGYRTAIWYLTIHDFTKWILDSFGNGSAEKKLSPEVLSWKQEHQLAILKAYLDGDGEKRETVDGDKKTHQNMSKSIERSSRFSTVSPKLVDGLERLCLQCGLGFQRTDEFYEDHEIWKKQYRCRIYGWNRVIVEYPEQTQRIENWTGMVHCVTVPNGLIFVRRNRKVVVSGNSGIFLSKVVGHAVNTVGRSVIIPNADLNMDEVGLPEKSAWESFAPFTMGRMVKDGMPSTEAARHLEEHSDLARKYLLAEMDHRPVLISRDPALHRFSIQGAHAKLMPGSSIHLSPLVVSGFGADFDGDQMNYHVPVSEEAVNEIKQKMMPSKNLLSLKSRQIFNVPTQEFILGINNSTTPNKNKQTSIFNTTEEAQQAYSRQEIDIDTPIQILKS